MLPAQRRINKSLFDQIIKRGSFVQTPLLSLSFLPSPLAAIGSRLAIVVSTKMLKKAVDRNKLKRRGRHAIYKNLQRLKDGFLGVFFFKKGMSGLSFKELEETMLKLLQQANLLLK